MNLKHAFTKLIQEKGYTLAEVGELFGLKKRAMAYHARNPSKRDMLAAKALPKRRRL